MTLCVPLLTMIMRPIAPPRDCPHPARNGRHEVYIRDGKTFCRACGKEDV